MCASAHAFLIPAFAAMALGFWQWSRARRSLPGRVASVLLVFTALPSIDAALGVMLARAAAGRSEEHTSELQSLMRISYAVFCLKKTKQKAKNNDHNIIIKEDTVQTTTTIALE